MVPTFVSSVQAGHIFGHILVLCGVRCPGPASLIWQKLYGLYLLPHIVVDLLDQLNL